MEPMSLVPVADHLTPRTGRTLSRLKRSRSFNGQSSKASKGGEKKRMRRTLSGLKHFVSVLCVTLNEWTDYGTEKVHLFRVRRGVHKKE